MCIGRDFPSATFERDEYRTTRFLTLYSSQQAHERMATLKDALQHSNMEEVMKILQSDHALPQRELNSALVTAISRDGPDDAIIPLLSHGAQITEGSICLAAARGDVVAFQAFLDYGWDINSLEFGQPALRYGIPV